MPQSRRTFDYGFQIRTVAHLFATGVIGVFCGVLIGLIIREAQIVKLNINIEPQVFGGKAGCQTIQLQLVSRRAKNFPLN